MTHGNYKRHGHHWHINAHACLLPVSVAPGASPICVRLAGGVVSPYRSRVAAGAEGQDKRCTPYDTRLHSSLLTWRHQQAHAADERHI